tara:strand:+ start:1937 stop:2617 length:681 start_codon:yes stop_codon:yes gene_type:complete
LALNQNVRLVFNRINSAKKRSPHNQDVELIAATKTRDILQIQTCFELGISSIGENRIQEAEKKLKELPSFNSIKKRFIGHLQTNKVNKCLRLFDTIDSVDTYKLAKKINSSSQRPKTECLIEINTSGELQKKGFKPKLSKELISCFSLENLDIVGLMTIGPYTTSAKEIRVAFQALRVFKEKINQELGENKLTELSMGMSNDFELGIEEGSTMVRVGTGLFGPRNY